MGLVRSYRHRWSSPNLPPQNWCGANLLRQSRWVFDKDNETHFDYQPPRTNLNSRRAKMVTGAELPIEERIAQLLQQLLQ